MSGLLDDYDKKKRRRGPQGPRGPSGGEVAMEVLDAPLRGVKKTLSGDEGIWFERPEGMSPEVWAAMQVAGDLGLDPLNFLGGGLWKKGAKGAKAAYGNLKQADKGMRAAAADNYINDYYGPNADKALTGMQKLASKGIENVQQGGLLEKLIAKKAPQHLDKIKGLNPEQVRGASQKLGSTLDTLKDAGLGAVKDTVLPSSRAKWRELGISGTGQKIIRDHMSRYDELQGQLAQLKKMDGQGLLVGDDIKKLESTIREERRLAKAGAEAVYQLYIGAQAGRKGLKADALKRFEKQIFDELPQNKQPGTITEITQRHVPQKKVDGEWIDAPVSPEDAAFFEQHIEKRWPGTTRVAVKNLSRSEGGGKHVYDLVGARNPNMRLMRQIMQEEKPKGVSWADHVQSFVDKHNAGGPEYKVVLHRGPDDSVWLESARPGTAIVEGGFNSLHKFEEGGKYIAWMSDEHNFLEQAAEQIPGAGGIMRKELPNNLVGITPPLMGQLTKTGKSAEGAYRTAHAARKAVQKKAKGKTPSAQDNLREIANAQPSEQALLAERQRTAGMGGVLAAAVNDPNN